MTELEHLSYSSISLWLSCGRAFSYRYIEHVQVPTAPELILGSAVHDAVEHLLTGASDVTSAWSEAWARHAGEEQIAWGDDTPETYYNSGLALLSSADVQKALANIVPAQDEQGPCIERRVALTVPTVPIPVIGYIDIITQDGVPADFKTSARSWTAEKAQNELQSLYYLAALNQMGREMPELKFRHYVLVKTKTPQFQSLEHFHRPSELFWLFELIQRAWKGISHDVFPYNPTSWRCSPAFCDYWELCRGR